MYFKSSSLITSCLFIALRSAYGKYSRYTSFASPATSGRLSWMRFSSHFFSLWPKCRNGSSINRFIVCISAFSTAEKREQLLQMWAASMTSTVWPASFAPRINSSARRLDDPFLLGLPSKTTILIVLPPAHRLSAHSRNSASEKFPLSIFPPLMSAPGQLPANSSAVRPNPLPPEVAKRTIFFPVKS